MDFEAANRNEAGPIASKRVNLSGENGGGGVDTGDPSSHKADSPLSVSDMKARGDIVKLLHSSLFSPPCKVEEEVVINSLLALSGPSSERSLESSMMTNGKASSNDSLSSPEQDNIDEKSMGCRPIPFSHASQYISNTNSSVSDALDSIASYNIDEVGAFEREWKASIVKGKYTNSPSCEAAPDTGVERISSAPVLTNGSQEDVHNIKQQLSPDVYRAFEALFSLGKEDPSSIELGSSSLPPPLNNSDTCRSCSTASSTPSEHLDYSSFQVVKEAHPRAPSAIETLELVATSAAHGFDFNTPPDATSGRSGRNSCRNPPRKSPKARKAKKTKNISSAHIRRRASSLHPSKEPNQAPLATGLLVLGEGFSKCNCRKSMCLKLYCECFQRQVYCNGCNCSGCQNNADHETHRVDAIKNCLSRNKDAFSCKFAKQSAGRDVHKAGCNCKKTACLKRYCECFQGGIVCSTKCRCEGCENHEGSESRALLVSAKAKRRKIKPAAAPMGAKGSV